VGFRAASPRARDQKLGVSAHQLASGESPVDGNFNHGPGTMVLLHTFYITGRPKPYIVEVRTSKENGLKYVSYVTHCGARVVEQPPGRPFLFTRRPNFTAGCFFIAYEPGPRIVLQSCDDAHKEGGPSMLRVSR
jgi:hypothetical protein